MRNYLLEKGYATGLIYRYWWTSGCFNTLEEMDESNKVTVNINKLIDTISKVETSETKVDFDTKEHRLIDNSDTYASIWYVIIAMLWKKNFYIEANSNTTVEKYTKTIDTLIQSFYYSEGIHGNQKKLIKKDKKLKHLIIEILHKKGIWKLENDKFTINETAKKQTANEFRNYEPKELVKDILKTINVIVKN